MRSSSDILKRYGKLYGPGRRRSKPRIKTSSPRKPQTFTTKLVTIEGKTYKVKVLPAGSAIHYKPDIEGRLKAELRKVRRGEKDKPDWGRINQ